MTIVEEQLLSVAARRAALCELADHYNAERTSNSRPLTEALPALLERLRGHAVAMTTAVDLFDQFARERAVSGRASATFDQMATAEQRAEFLLDTLVGEA